MKNKMQIIIASIISFSVGVFTANYFFQQRVSPSSYQIKKVLSRDVKEVPDSKEISSEENTPPTLLIGSSDIALTSKGTESKKIDYIALSTQVDSFQELIREKLKNKFQIVYSSDLKKKGNAEKKYILESNLSEMFSEKKTSYKASLKKNEKSEQLHLSFALTDCKNFEKMPTSTLLDDVCYRMNAYLFINKKWYKINRWGNYGSAEWIGDQPFTMFYSEYTEGLMKASGILRTFIPLPAKTGQMLSLKYISQEFVWEQGGDIEWQPTTEKEIKDFEKTVESYIQSPQSSEEQ